MQKSLNIHESRKETIILTSSLKIIPKMFESWQLNNGTSLLTKIVIYSKSRLLGSTVSSEFQDFQNILLFLVGYAIRSTFS
jgi:hypothetical protein